MVKILTEHNSNRKSHRVTIPLLVDISGKVYQCIDWSVTGFAIIDLEQVWQLDELKKLKIILPIKEASLSIHVHAKLKNLRDNKFGFEFHDLDIKNKRILRHYIEMAVDGRTDSIEDLIGISASPSVETPIVNALNLNEIEEHKLIKKFKSRSLVSIFIGMLFTITLLLIFSQKWFYQIKTIGTVVGNTNIIYSPFDGVISNIFLEKNAYVQKNAPIVLIENHDDSVAINGLKTQILYLENQLNTNLDLAPTNYQTSSLITMLAKKEKILKQNLKNASDLLQRKIINKKDVANLESELWQISINLEKEKVKLNQNRLIQVHNFNKETVLTQTKLNQKIFELKKKLSLIQDNSNTTLHSKFEGRLLSTIVSLNEPIFVGDPIAIISNNSKPHVIITIDNIDSLKVQIGQSAKVFVPYFDKFVLAKVVSFEQNSSATNWHKQQNVSQVKLEFNDNIKIPPNIKVEVWIKTIDWLV